MLQVESLGPLLLCMVVGKSVRQSVAVLGKAQKESSVEVVTERPSMVQVVASSMVEVLAFSVLVVGVVLASPGDEVVVLASATMVLVVVLP